MTKPISVHLGRRLLAEFVGSLFLAAVVVGSGIAAQNLSPHNIGIELLENAAATAVALYALIAALGPVSGAYFNPIVSIIDAGFGRLLWRDVPWYVITQVIGCSSGAVLANLMFSTSAITLSTHNRASGAHLLAEVVATAGLVLIIFSLTQSRRADLCAAAVGSYIGAAYFFTSSTSFANPAITVGRMLTNSFAGIAPSSVLGFIAAQLLGAVLGGLIVLALYPRKDNNANFSTEVSP